MPRLVSADAFTGVVEYLDYDSIEDMTYIRREQRVDPILERNKALQNEANYMRRGIKNEWMHAASIPNIVIEQWMKEGINFFDKNDWPKVRAKLNDREYSYLKTIPGKL